MAYETAFRPRIVSVPLGNQVADEIRREILAGTLRPGEVLQQDALCGRYGTSRMPVRDALRQLCHEGFLVWSPTHHVQVATFTRWDVEDMFEALAVLCGRLARRATERADESDLDELFGLHEEMEACLAEGRREGLWERNRYFHRRIDALGESPKLVAALRAVTIDLHRDVLYVTDEQAARSNAEHAVLLAAMRARDARRSEELMAVHVTEARDDVVAHLAGVGVLQEDS